MTHGAEVAGAWRGVKAQQQPGDGDHVVLHEGLAGQGGRSEAGHPGGRRAPSASRGEAPPGRHSPAGQKGSEGQRLPGAEPRVAPFREERTRTGPREGRPGPGRWREVERRLPAGRPGASLPPAPADLIEQRVQHADAEDTARGEGQAEHEGQVGTVFAFPLQERGTQGRRAGGRAHGSAAVRAAAGGGPQASAPATCPPSPPAHSRPEPGSRDAGLAWVSLPRVPTNVSHFVIKLVVLSEVGRAGGAWAPHVETTETPASRSLWRPRGLSCGCEARLVSRS